MFLLLNTDKLNVILDVKWCYFIQIIRYFLYYFLIFLYFMWKKWLNGLSRRNITIITFTFQYEKCVELRKGQIEWPSESFPQGFAGSIPALHTLYTYIFFLNKKLPYGYLMKFNLFWMCLTIPNTTFVWTFCLINNMSPRVFVMLWEIQTHCYMRICLSSIFS